MEGKCLRKECQLQVEKLEREKQVLIKGGQAHHKCLAETRLKLQQMIDEDGQQKQKITALQEELKSKDEKIALLLGKVNEFEEKQARFEIIEAELRKKNQELLEVVGVKLAELDAISENVKDTEARCNELKSRWDREGGEVLTMKSDMVDAGTMTDVEEHLWVPAADEDDQMEASELPPPLLHPAEDDDITFFDESLRSPSPPLLKRQCRRRGRPKKIRADFGASRKLQLPEVEFSTSWKNSPSVRASTSTESYDDADNLKSDVRRSQRIKTRINTKISGAIKGKVQNRPSKTKAGPPQGQKRMKALLKCFLCGHLFGTGKLLMDHIAGVHCHGRYNYREKYGWCPQCGTLFSTLGQVKVHKH